MDTKYVQNKTILLILYTKYKQNMYKPIVFTGFGVGRLLSTFQNMFGDSSHVIADRLRNLHPTTVGCIDFQDLLKSF